jgi:hypothetical protein
LQIFCMDLIIDKDPNPESKTTILAMDVDLLNQNNSLLAKFSLKLI